MRRQFLLWAAGAGVGALAGCGTGAGPAVRWAVLGATEHESTPGLVALNHGVNVWVIRRAAISVHHVLTPEPGGRAAAVIVQWADRLWVVDTLGAPAYGQQLRAYADSLGQRIDRVVLTHEHPDAWYGYGAFSTAAAWATSQTAAYLQSRASSHALPQGVRPPALAGELAAGQESVGGVRVQWYPAPYTESAGLVALGLPDQAVFLAAGLVSHQRHAYVGLRQWARWRQALDALPAWVKAPSTVLLPGRGAPTDGRAVAQMQRYLEAVEEAFARWSTPREIEDAIKAQFPDYGGVSLLRAGVSHAFARGPGEPMSLEDDHHAHGHKVK